MAAPKDRRPGFSRRAQYGLFVTSILAIAGAVVGAVLLVLQRFNPPAFAALRSGVAEVTAPVSTALAVAGDGIASVPEAIGTYFRVHDENERLRAEVKRDRALVIRARAIVYENLRLRRIAQLRDGDASAVAVARIVSSTPASTRRFGLLNAGLWQGVRGGQPVRGPNGLVGRASRLLPFRRVDEVWRHIDQPARGGDAGHVARIPAVARRIVLAQETAARLGDAQQAGQRVGRAGGGGAGIAFGMPRRETGKGIPAGSDEAAVHQDDGTVGRAQRRDQPEAGAQVGQRLDRRRVFVEEAPGETYVPVFVGFFRHLRPFGRRQR